MTRRSHLATRKHEADQPTGADALPTPVFAREPGTRAAELLILLEDGCSPTALAGLTEPFRLANEFLRERLYSWSFATVGDGTVSLANGLEIQGTPLDAAIAQTPQNVIVLGRLLGRGREDEIQAKRLRNSLARWCRGGARITAVGPGVLPALRVLPNARTLVCSHWRQRRLVEELYADCTATDEIFAIGPGMTTCAGEMAAFDLALADIAAAHGRQLALRIAETLLLETIRDGRTRQYRAISGTYGARNARVRRAIELMREHVEDPQPIHAIAESIGISPRQLERLFQNHVGVSPSVYARRLRLEHARELLQHTDMPLVEIAIAVGFGGYSQFQKAYKKYLGRNPAQYRSRSKRQSH
jgi:transcriptional regulator GlxA family with amidase domain